jgi:CRISPR system Cascade subunit CasD
MSTLLLRLAAPLQSWGCDSSFETRRTEMFPTKSGIIGLTAAALGRKRDEPLDDLNRLKFGVRVDNEGEVIRDYHIARNDKDVYLTNRYYLSDAVFLAGLESNDENFLKEIENAFRMPVFSLFLGRRSCPPTMPILIGIRKTDLLTSLKTEPWLLEEWRQKSFHNIDSEHLRIIADSDFSETDSIIRDKPVSFSQIHRKYDWRYVKDYGYVSVKQPETTEHDAMAELR